MFLTVLLLFVSKTNPNSFKLPIKSNSEGSHRKNNPKKKMEIQWSVMDENEPTQAPPSNTVNHSNMILNKINKKPQNSV